MHGFTNIEFLSMLGTVLGAGDTLVEKRTDKKPCFHGAYILLGKKIIEKLPKCRARTGKYLEGRRSGQ